MLLISQNGGGIAANYFLTSGSDEPAPGDKEINIPINVTDLSSFPIPKFTPTNLKMIVAIHPCHQISPTKREPLLIMTISRINFVQPHKSHHVLPTHSCALK
jgi:hypothetical protein